MTAAEAPSYYDRLGGAPTIKEAVDRFYVRLLDDADLKHYFADTDVAQLKRHQVLLLSQVLGGPTEYSGRELSEAHRGLAITEAHYDKVGAHLLGVLAEMGAPADIADAVAQTLKAVRDDIVDPAAGS
jgi:hemoglobin